MQNAASIDEKYPRKNITASTIEELYRDPEMSRLLVVLNVYAREVAHITGLGHHYKPMIAGAIKVSLTQRHKLMQLCFDLNRASTSVIRALGRDRPDEIGAILKYGHRTMSLIEDITRKQAVLAEIEEGFRSPLQSGEKERSDWVIEHSKSNLKGWEFYRDAEKYIGCMMHCLCMNCTDSTADASILKLPPAFETPPRPKTMSPQSPPWTGTVYLLGTLP